MKWVNVNVIQYIETSKDKLGNPVTIPSIKGSTKGRFTDWTEEETQTFGYDYTVNNRKLLLIPIFEINTINTVSIENEEYEITNVAHSSLRWYLLHVKRCK